MAIPNFHFQSDDTSTKYAQDMGAMLEFMSMIDGSLVQFKAFLTTFSQDFSSTWNTETVFGRVDPIPTFSNTTRKIQLAWDIPAYGIEDAMNNLAKCQSIIQMMYPNYQEGAAFNYNNDGSPTSYTKANTLSKPPLIKVKFANLIANSFTASENGGSVDTAGLLGWADGVSWQPNLEAGMFVNKLTDRAAFFPKMISLSMNFNVLHQGTPTINGNSSAGFPFVDFEQSMGTANPNVSPLDTGNNEQ